MAVTLAIALAGTFGIWLALAARAFSGMLATLHRRDVELSAAREKQERLAEKVTELQAVLDNVRQLTGLLPICSYCKRIRNDEDGWERVEAYVTARTDAKFTHGICPTCFESARAEFFK